MVQNFNQMTIHIKRRPIEATNTFNQTLHPILQRIYCARGIHCSTELERTLQQLLPYHQLKDIDHAVNHLYQALLNHKHIMIIGDFDADGATSTALAVTALRSFGAKQVSYLVPNRFAYGYGLSPEIVEEAAKQKPDLIVTVDNGIA
ncbi:MAG: recJ, partial [Gammaproteobacteria bacterium]|nr:recJ [Gammaproteobacteria bacterium]